MANTKQKKKWTKVGPSQTKFGGVAAIDDYGHTKTLLSPSERGAKYATELREGYKQTNNGVYKRFDDGTPIDLNVTERAYRAGYLDAQKDSAGAFKSRNPGYKPKKTKK